ncbi:MAG: CBS domain-containing protein [Bacteroidota bacterium]|nr:CBS domain-containing protein [Kiloniellaceae bacterium]
MLARDIMQPTTEVVHLDQTLLDAGIRLQQARLAALPVVDGDEIVGLLTRQAIEDKVVSLDNDLANTAVRDHMSAEIAFCHDDESAETARRLMDEGGHSRLLVVDRQGRLCGIIAAGDAGPQEEKGAADDEHVVKTGGRGTGSRPHQPPGFSVKPVIKK